jgi:hypothetical protein
MTDSARQRKKGLGWREYILKHFTPEIAAATRMTIVADPDHLLSEQECLDVLRARGFDMVPFEDHVAFRFAYESRYRQHWDRGSSTNLVVVLRTPREDVESLPFDLVEQARGCDRCLRFTIGALFPNLVPTIVGELDRGDFDALFDAQRQLEPGPLGTNDTKDFILRHVFGVAPEVIKKPSDLLHALLRRHYRGKGFPASLDDRFIKILEKSDRWTDWPLDQIVPDRAAFLGFLQERWPIFLQKQVENRQDGTREPVIPGELRYLGPIDIPFDHDDVKVYIDNLFLEGHLVPTQIMAPTDVAAPWMRVGVASVDESSGELERFARLSERIEKELPGPDADHRAWPEYARVWAEWAASRWKLADQQPAMTAAWERLHDAIEVAFSAWMADHYASLHNLSFVQRPIMVHHVPHHMARRFTPSGPGATRRYALVVVDGLALDQWVLLRHALRSQLAADVRLDEDAAFAWVPTLTGVSRQSIFAGEPPFLFGATLGSTHKEPVQWQRFWEEHGAGRQEIGYACQKQQEPDGAFFDRVRPIFEHPKMRVLGLVVGTVDQSMHGVVTGTRGLQSLVRDWAQSGAMARMITSLLDGGFEVFITADHGNIEGTGIGKPNVGAVADERGERVHVFADELTRKAVLEQFPASLAWPQVGLPETYFALLAAGRGAFIHEGKTTVAHGGIGLEEVLVPFVKIDKGG